MDERVRIGILGCGHVGGALVRLIHDHADVIEARAGVPLEVARVAVRDLTKERDLPLPPACFTDDASAVVGDPDVDIVVEVIGGIEPARALIVEALMGGKPVVTANKELHRHPRPRAVRDRRGRGRRPPVRGVGGRWHPADPAAARVAGRRPHPPRDGHRQRHHQLHPHPHDRAGYVVRRRARRGAALGFAETRSHRRRRRLRRRGQGRDHRFDRVRRARRRRRRVPRGHHRASPATTSRRRATSGTW